MVYWKSVKRKYVEKKGWKFSFFQFEYGKIYLKIKIKLTKSDLGSMDSFSALTCEKMCEKT